MNNILALLALFLCLTSNLIRAEVHSSISRTGYSIDGNPLFSGFSVEPAQPQGVLTVHVYIRKTKLSDLSVELEAQNTESWETISSRKPVRSGQWQDVELASPKLVQGPYWLKARLWFRGSLIDEKESSFRVQTQVVDDKGSNLPQIIPGGALILHNLPRWCVGGDAFANPLPYIPTHSYRGINLEQGEKTTINLPLSDEYAVYISVGNPWPRFTIRWGNAQHTIQQAPSEWPLPGGIQEHFVGFGAFTKGPIIIETPDDTLHISHIRVARLTPSETELIHYQADPIHNRRVIYNNDGYSELWGMKGWDKAHLLQLVERYQDTDTEIFEMAALLSGTVNYPSKYATFWRRGELPDDQWVRAKDKMTMELFNQLEADHIPIFPTLTKRGRELGISVFGSLRMSAYYELTEQQKIQPFNGKLWHEHPEMRIRQRNGNYDTQMSFAWEAVRNERLGVLRELLEMGCDGISMDFCRYPKVLGYDEPSINGFKQKYGVSPIDLPEYDERWMSYQSEILNDFFRAVRRQTDEIARQQGRKLRISVRVPATGYQLYGFDPQTWAKEQLMDIFIPHYPGLERDFDVRPWVTMVKGTNVKVYPGIEKIKTQSSNTELTDAEISRGVKPGVVTTTDRDEYLRKAWRRYRQGADGVFLFNVPAIGDERNLLGDKRSLARWSYFEDPMNLPRDKI